MPKVSVISVNFKSPSAVSPTDKVNLRDVHKGLKSGRDFSSWATYYLPNFEENQDFGLLTKSGEQENHSGKSGAGHNRKDFWITVSAAKELAMLQQTAEGRAIRRYFLECEALVHANGLQLQVTHIPTLVNSDFLFQLAGQLKAKEEQIIQLESKTSDLSLKLGMATDCKRTIGWQAAFPKELGGTDPSVLGRKLTKLGLEIGVPAICVEDQKHGQVKSHFRSVVLEYIKRNI